MKRKTRLLLERSVNSLVLGIELFNRPSDRGRVESVVMLLDHSFEMLLKSAIFEKTGRIRAPRERFNYTFDKCIDICRSRLGALSDDEALILQNLNGFRDAATHDVLIIDEGLLYSHVQSAVNISAKMLKEVFRRSLASVLPKRILPVTAMVPQDIQILVSTDLESIRSMLSGKHRREDEAEARLRAYQVMEKNLRVMQGESGKRCSPQQLIQRMKKGEWRTALPMVAGLVQATPGGIPISIHVTKSQGIPVRIDKDAPQTIAFRYIRPEDKYPHLTSELAVKLDISTNKVVGLAKLLGLKGNDDYHMTMRIGKTSNVHRYSHKALQLLDVAIKKDGLDALWQLAKTGQKKDTTSYELMTESEHMETKIEGKSEERSAEALVA